MPNNLPSFCLTQGFYDEFTDGILIVDVKGVVLYVNKIIEDTTEYQNSEIIGKAFYQLPFLSKKTALTLVTNFTDRLRGKRLTPYNLEITTKSGLKKYLRVSGNVISLDNAIPTHIFFIIQDITEQELGKADYQRISEIATKYFETSNNIKLVLTKEGVVLAINQKGADLLGYPKDQIIGKNWFETFVPEENVRKIKEVFSKIIRGELDEDSKSYVNPIKRSDGKHILVRWTNSYIKDDSGEIYATFGSGEDISELESAKKQTKTLEERFKVLYDYAPYAIFLYNRLGQFVDSNLKAEELTGYPKSELIGKEIVKSGIIDPINTPQIISMLQKTFLGDRLDPEILPIITKRGDKKLVEIAVHPVTVADEELFLGIARDVTYERLQQEEIEKIRLGIELANDIVFMTDAEGKFTYINPQFEKVYGYKLSECEGKTPRILKSGLQDAKFYEEFWLSIKVKKERKTFEIINKTKNGQIVVMQASVSPIIGKSGELSGFLAIQHDITEQKDQEKLLKDERDKFDLLVKTMGEGVVMLNKNGVIEYVNPAAKELLEIKDDDINKRWIDEAVRIFQGDEEIAPRNTPCAQVMATAKGINSSIDDNYYYQLPSGKRFPVESIINPVVHDGIVQGIVIVFRDASEEKEARMIIEQTVEEKSKELEIERVRSASILENIQGSVVVTDTSGAIVYTNSSFEALSGFPKEELIRKVFADVIKATSLEGKPFDKTQLSDAAAVTAENYQTKLIIIDKNNNKIPALMHSSPVRVNNEFKGVVRVLHDFTKDYELQQQKDDFFSIASHELRTPLTVISGNLDILLSDMRKSQMTPDEEQLLQDSMQASDRLIKLVNDFLNVSRLDQRRVQARTTEFNICQIVSDVVKELDILAKRKNITIETMCGSEIKIKADESLTKEILINLIGNSIKFTQNGGIRVTISNKAPMVSVLVIDTGQGIAKEKQGLLFNRFQQVSERTLSRDGGGTGLGLYISREFAHLMEGDLKLVQSELGRGSVFELTLPLFKKGY